MAGRNPARSGARELYIAGELQVQHSDEHGRAIGVPASLDGVLVVPTAGSAMAVSAVSSPSAIAQAATASRAA